MYTVIKVVRDADIHQQIGSNVFFDLIDIDSLPPMRVQKQLPFQDFKDQVANSIGIPPQFQRWWIWAKRVNNTIRPLRPLTAAEEAKTVLQIRESASGPKSLQGELKLYLETNLEFGLGPPLPTMPTRQGDQILLFLKKYDPEEERLSYVGHVLARLSWTVEDLKPVRPTKSNIKYIFRNNKQDHTIS